MDIDSNTATVRRCLCEYASSADDGRLPWDYSVLCSFCCKHALRHHVERHDQALLERDLARERCAQTLSRLSSFSLQTQEKRNQQDSSDIESHTSTPSSTFSELQFESRRLRDRRAKLQQQCAAMAVEVAALAVDNEERQASLDPQAELKRQQLRRLDESVCEGSLRQAIDNAREQSRILRFQWALKAFAMHRLDVRPEDIYDDTGDDSVIEGARTSSCRDFKKSQSDQRRHLSLLSKEGRQKQARGIGKIGGLPIPHAGQELYGVLPPQELQSALRLVASVTSTVSRCLGIILPHPILLQLSSTYIHGDIIHSAILPAPTATIAPQKQNDKPSHGALQEDASDPTSTEALLALLNTSLDESSSDGNRSAYGKTDGAVASSGRKQGLEERANSTVVPPSMDSSLVAQRLRHATAAVLAEADPSNNHTSSSSSSSSSSPATSSQYALAAEVMYQDEFAIALQLLQNNVIALCIRAGVPVAKLWPAEAVLLNLYALQVFCEDQVKTYLK